VDKRKERHAIYGEKKDIEVVVTYAPLRVSLLRNGKEEVVLNGQGLLHMEHFRVKDPSVEQPESVQGYNPDDEAQVVIKAKNANAWFEGDTEDALWEETFSTWIDSKPKGQSQVSGRSLLYIYHVSCRP
jgi:alpha 1,3-glucosidase